MTRLMFKTPLNNNMKIRMKQRIFAPLSPFAASAVGLFS
jgi:hypothetical protein